LRRDKDRIVGSPSRPARTDSPFATTLSSTAPGSLATAALLAFLLAGRRHGFAAALSGPAVWVLAVTALLQIVALLVRSESWHLTIQAAGGTVDRRVLYRASSIQVLGSVINGQLRVAARIAALRRSSPAVSLEVPTLIAAEFPVLAVEATPAALTSFTLVAPLRLPRGASARRPCGDRDGQCGLRISPFARAASCEEASRCSVACAAEAVRSASCRLPCSHRSSALAAAARGRRRCLVLRCDRVLIAVVTLGQLPVGRGVGAAAAVLILGSDGVAAAAAAGVLTPVKGTVGGLCFAGWAGADRLWSGSRRARLRRARGPRGQGSARAVVAVQEASTITVQGHFTAPAKRLRAEHRRPHAERRSHGQFRPQRRKSRFLLEEQSDTDGDSRARKVANMPHHRVIATPTER
jgi:hypothetical protein